MGVENQACVVRETIMTAQHPHIAILARLSEVFPHDLDNAERLLAPDFVWHYFNPELPDLQGDYVGLDGVRTFFKALSELTDGTFAVKDKEVIYIGDELVVTLAQPSMTLDETSFETDAVVVWRIVGDRPVEAWDIPAIYSMRPQILNPVVK